MARVARKKGVSGILHIMLRGIDKQNIFLSTEDYNKFMLQLARVKEKFNFTLYAYCLLSNHVHLLINSNDNEPGTYMQCLETSYAQYFNKQYSRVGHLFQNRFKSEVVDDDPYFITVIKYIHFNPIKAGIVSKLDDYLWSSYREFKNPTGLLNTKFVLELFGGMKSFLDFHLTNPEENCLDYENKITLPYKEIQNSIQSIIAKCNFATLNDEKKGEVFRKIIEKTNISIRQLAKELNINRTYISKVLK